MTKLGFSNWMVGLLASWTVAGPAHAQIRWRTGDVALPALTQTQVVDALAPAAPQQTARHVTMQFDQPMTKERRAALKAGGINLLSYLGNNAFFATVQAGGANQATLAKTTSLVATADIQPRWKLHTILDQGQRPDWAVVPAPADQLNVANKTWIGAYILFHEDVAPADALAVVTARGIVVRRLLQTVNAMVVELPLEDIPVISALDEVQYIEPALPPMSGVNDSNRVITQADIVQNTPYGLDGSGVSVLVYDAGTARATHVDFSGRLTARDASGLSSHSTHVAGTIGGAGIANPVYKGMAPGVTIESYGFEQVGGLRQGFLYTDPGDLEADYNEAINVYGTVISNNSIGTNTAPNGFPCAWEGDYGVTAALIDSIVAGSLGQPFRIIWANGNERGSGRCGTTYHTTAPPACAKNHITVGALNSNDDSVTYFTSWGPTDDDRLKPDISAPGCQVGGDGGVTSCSSASDTSYTTFCGTSMASPTVCGLSALLLQDYRDQFPGQPDFRNSTLKALLAHNAQDTQEIGPDYKTGYGSVRIQKTVDFMRTGAFLEDTLDQGQVFSRQVVIQAGDPELRATLAWDDVPGTPNVIPSLVNDLDLWVTSPSGVRHYPWTLGGLANPGAPALRTQEDHINNIEQVLVDTPEPGVWTVEVHAFNVPLGPQVFSLVGHGATRESTTISFPNGLPTFVDSVTPTVIDVDIISVGETLVPGSPTFYYRFDGGTYQIASLTFVTGDRYQATLPPAPCGTRPEFYFSAEGTNQGVVLQPAGAPATVFSAEVGSFTVLLDDDFEIDQGWTVGAPDDTATQGIWNRGDPVGTIAQPEDDHTPAPATLCYATDTRGGAAGAFDVDGGKSTLLSPVFDAAQGDVTVGYWRWYSNDSGAGPNSDTFRVDVSNDGVNWTNVETIGGAFEGQHSGGWFYHEFVVHHLVTPTATMRIRFVAEDNSADGQSSLVEAAVDDVLITRNVCEPAGLCNDRVLNQGEDRIDCGGPCTPCECIVDADCDDGLFCNGVETCNAYGACVSTGAPCSSSEWCEELIDACVPVTSTGIIYVDASATGNGNGRSWTDAYTSLQFVSGASAIGDTEIWVAAGTYTVAPPGGNPNATLQLNNGMALYGGFAGFEVVRTQRDPTTNLTILSGNLGTTSSIHVVTAVGVDATAVLDGFVISDGNAGTGSGGGLLIQNGTPTIVDCTFSNNSAASGGGVEIVDANLTFTNCSFNGNIATSGDGGGVHASSTAGGNQLVFTNCTFSQNSAYQSTIGQGNGGAVYNGSGVTLTVSDCTFDSNSAWYNMITGVSATGGAIANVSPGAMIANSVFLNGYANLGGGVYSSGDITFVNTMFIGNQAADAVSDNIGNIAGQGGGIYTSALQAALVNCTLYNNWAFKKGGGAAVANAIVENCIIRGNTVPPVCCGENPLVPVRIQIAGGNLLYSNIEGIFTGLPGEDPPNPADFPGSIDADPLFVDVANNDLHLSAGSPSIDAGDNAAVPVGTSNDLDGKPRFSDDPATPDTGLGTPPIVDMGAYEFAVAPPAVQADLDGDGDVDPNDFLMFSNCFNGAMNPPLLACVTPAADLDADGDVDGNDFLTFSNCFNGSLNPPSCP